MSDTRPIGVFDSGLGGLTVLNAIKKIIPNENIVYVGDTARVPYGNKSTPLIVQYASQITKFLLEKFNLKIRCYCVGGVTETVAKQAGFINTYSSEGTVDSLIELVKRTLDKKSGKLLYLSSEFISKDLDKDLIESGFSIDRISNYTSISVEEINKLSG